MILPPDLSKENLAERFKSRTVQETEEHPNDRKHRHRLEWGRASAGWVVMAALLVIAVWCLHVANTSSMLDVRQLNGTVASGILGVVIGYFLSKLD